MATTIPCTIDTKPMAREIDSMTRHINGTTTAVVAMEAAVIAAEEASARKICHNVNKGFFTMMRSQISQKIATKRSRVEALLIKLNQQKRRLVSIQSNMEREYGRIAARYLRTFTVINKELENRIHQVDEPVFNIVNKHMATSSNRMNALTGVITTSQFEGITQSQKIIVSNIKHNAQIALGLATDFLAQINEQRALSERVLIPAHGKDVDKPFYIPIAICEMNNEADILHTEIDLPQDFPTLNTNAINSAVRSENTFNWKECDKKDINSEFSAILAKSAASPRVKDMIQQLYSTSAFKTL